MSYSSRNDMSVTERELRFDNIFNLSAYQSEILEVCDEFSVGAQEIRTAFSTIEELVIENEELLNQIYELKQEKNNG